MWKKFNENTLCKCRLAKTTNENGVAYDRLQLFNSTSLWFDNQTEGDSLYDLAYKIYKLGARVPRTTTTANKPILTYGFYTIGRLVWSKFCNNSWSMETAI